MGKLMTKYLREYHNTINNELKDTSTLDVYIVPPEIWIAVKWMRENNLSPNDPRFTPLMIALYGLDQELATAIVKGATIIIEQALEGVMELNELDR